MRGEMKRAWVTKKMTSQPCICTVQEHYANFYIFKMLLHTNIQGS